MTALVPLPAEGDPHARPTVAAPTDPIRHAALAVARWRLHGPVNPLELVPTWAEPADIKAVEAELARIADTLSEPPGGPR